MFVLFLQIHALARRARCRGRCCHCVIPCVCVLSHPSVGRAMACRALPELAAARSTISQGLGRTQPGNLCKPLYVLGGSTRGSVRSRRFASYQWVICTLVQNPDLGWPEARHIRLDDRAPTHVGVEDLHHVTDCFRSGKKPSIGYEMGPFHPPSDGKHLCRGIEID